MSAAQYILIGWFVFAALATIAMVGKERQPLPPAGAVFNVIFYAGIILLVVAA